MRQVLKAPKIAKIQKGKPLAAALRKSSHFQTVAEVVGEDAVPIVQYLKGKKNISEFKIAESIKAEVNSVRKMLYAMQNNNLVSYYRKKDRQKGWYISYWTLNDPGFNSLAIATMQQRLQQFKERLRKEEAHHGLFYICPSLCVRLEFEKAAEISFKCPECGSMLQHQDNTKTIEQLRQKIGEIEAKK
ncbi:hypothetical protein HYU17_06065 [Candidatus Woesearchaeota archaeon]|nr:hypothetical protein [Candidatus Woesearchaeota archaeon]